MDAFGQSRRRCVKGIAMEKNPLVAALEAKTDSEMAQDKPLAAKLAAVADEVRALSPLFANAVDEFVGRLQKAEAGVQAPQIGDMLPDFVLPDQTGKLMKLSQFLERGRTIVTFLRGHWCPYCRLTAAALGDLNALARSQGWQIVAITPESQKFARMLDADSGGGLPILSDLDNGYALSLNLAIWVDESMSDLIASAGWDIPAYNNDRSWTLPIPAAFSLDTDGRIRARYVNPDYRERADYARMIAALELA
jgi:peroxiredoxin